MTRITTIKPVDATGQLKEIYDGLMASRGKIAEVHKMHSLNPGALQSHMGFYMAVMFKKSPMKRAQREMLGVIVSVTNNCEYCRLHHSAALNFYWKDETKMQAFWSDYKTAGLEAADQLLCEYAILLTLDPSSGKMGEMIQQLKNSGFSDLAIHDATLVIGYFNFVNRMVTGLGVEVEEDYGGYKY
ncbi:MAG: peroxidase-related enzyme [Bacteroidales bacterium]|nr:peroxidase-related enzyme [Bacteroidales bacterium]